MFWRISVLLSFIHPLYPLRGQSSPINHRCAGGGSRLHRAESKWAPPTNEANPAAAGHSTPIYCRLIAPTAAMAAFLLWSSTSKRTVRLVVLGAVLVNTMGGHFLNRLEPLAIVKLGESVPVTVLMRDSRNSLAPIFSMTVVLLNQGAHCLSMHFPLLPSAGHINRVPIGFYRHANRRAVNRFGAHADFGSDFSFSGPFKVP